MMPGGGDPPSAVPGTTERPRAPDPDVLEAATRALTERRQAEVDPSWQVLGREVRRWSTVFRVRTRCSGVATDAYYKQIHRDCANRGQWDNRRLSRMRQAMHVEREVASRLSRALTAIDVQIDQPLVLEPDRLVAVRMAVAGRPLGKAIWSAFLGRRGLGRQRFHRIGEAMRVVEEIGATYGPATASPTIAERLWSEFDRTAATVTPEVRSRLEELLAALAVGEAGHRRLVWTHGDLSPTNVLVVGSRLGLIDFSWARHIPGRDVVQLVSRIETERPRLEEWSREATSQLLEGYTLGPTGSQETWQLARLERVIKAVRSPRDPLRLWALAMLDDLGE